MSDATGRAMALIADAIQMDVAHLPRDASIESLPQWDSLNHMRIVLLLEETLSRQIETDELLSIVDVDSVATILAAEQRQR